jgi:hypothetical protein
MNLPAPIRAVLGFLALATVLVLVCLAGVIAVLNLGTVAGIGITMIVAATGMGLAVWWIDHKGLL